MSPKIVTAATTVALLVAALALPGTAGAQGASECQPAAAELNVFLAHEFDGLGKLAKPLATSDPGAIAVRTKGELFLCP